MPKRENLPKRGTQKSKSALNNIQISILNEVFKRARLQLVNSEPNNEQGVIDVINFRINLYKILGIDQLPESTSKAKEASISDKDSNSKK